ncbi:hypothetical protein [Oligoflexus tunisiensis]|uniref:hypothetical protein n=1 Tax=Oligoflexus tunisiensis TaxID=708132 RepID=UPI00114CDF62|nr:hypothetical protein [Oligoflexus tunisiensis]
MVIRNRCLGSVVLSFVVLAACQVPPKAQDEAVTHQEPRGTQGDASEGVVGPDEAFFAAWYLDQVFRYSRDYGSPTLDSGFGPMVPAGSVSAFDFQANFTEARLQLMTQSLYAYGDLDRDGQLTEQEFIGLKIDPALLGRDADKISHAFDQAFFLRVAGADELIQIDECAEFLHAIGPMIQEDLDRLTAQEQRRLLIHSWELVLGRYDADQSGSLSLQEQRDLRKDRALLISRLLGE